MTKCRALVSHHRRWSIDVYPHLPREERELHNFDRLRIFNAWSEDVAPLRSEALKNYYSLPRRDMDGLISERDQGVIKAHQLCDQKPLKAMSLVSRRRPDLCARSVSDPALGVGSCARCCIIRLVSDHVFRADGTRSAHFRDVG